MKRESDARIRREAQWQCGAGAGALAGLAAAAALAVVAGIAAAAERSEFNDPGNILIADQFNNRVIEIDPRTHRVVWQFGDGSDQPGAHSVVGVNDAERVGRFTLIAGTGIPGSSPPLPGCATPDVGCPDNRVLLVDERGRIIWQYGQAGVAGAGPDELNTPVHALFVTEFPHHPGPHVLVTDQGNARVILVNLRREIVWQYLTNTEAGSNPAPLPTRAVRLRNGNTLIADQFNQRVLEIDSDANVVFEQGLLNSPGDGFDRLNGPYDAKVIGDYTGLTPPLD